MIRNLISLSVICLFSFINPSVAGEADITSVVVDCDNLLCRFQVTVKHDDEGWNHYAKAIEILDADKTKVLGFRPLRHPHVNEQPFTRTVSVLFKEPVPKVIVRAFDSVHHYGGAEIEVDVPLTGSSD